VYTYGSVPFFFSRRGPGLSPDTPDPMTELFVTDITDGITGTGAEAGRQYQHMPH
jgi:phosphotriesterase-related protein